MSSEAIFYPDPTGDDKEVQKWEQLVNAEFNKMQEFLHTVEVGGVRDKLHDQLIWLRFQIKYFSESHDLDMLEENFNWVVSNFNHDLKLPKPMQKLARH